MTLSLIRIDNRLIHGQVMTMWSKVKNINHILAVDDLLAKDDFLKRVYTMAVPNTMKVDIYSIDEAISHWKNGILKDSNYLVLIKDVESALRLWKGGFEIERLQVGNLESKLPTGMLHKNTRLNKEHLPYLEEIMNGGVDVYIQSVPTEKEIPLKKFL